MLPVPLPSMLETKTPRTARRRRVFLQRRSARELCHAEKGLQCSRNTVQYVKRSQRIMKVLPRETLEEQLDNTTKCELQSEYTGDMAKAYWRYYSHVPTRLSVPEIPEVDTKTVYAAAPLFRGLGIDTIKSAIVSSAVEHRYVISMYQSVLSLVNSV